MQASLERWYLGAQRCRNTHLSLIRIVVPLFSCTRKDLQRVVPLDYTGDGNLPPRVLDMSAIPATGMGAPGMMGMPPGIPSGGSEQEVGDQIKSEITVGGKKNKTHYGKKFGKKHKSAMLDFTKSLWMQDAAASLRNVLKSEVGSRSIRVLGYLYNSEVTGDVLSRVLIPLASVFR